MYSIEPVASALPGTGFHGDAGFEVIDWNDDGKPDLFIYDTGAMGSGFIYLNDGTRDHPHFDHGVPLPYNATETVPQTLQHISSRAFCDLNGDGLVDFIFFDGKLRYIPNTGTKHAPFLWSLWPDNRDFFPGTARMIAENARYSTGPESIYWNKGIFARQVLTVTAVDWDGDGLQDLLICRTRDEAPGVSSLGIPEEWTDWGRIAAAPPKTEDRKPAGPPALAPLREAPPRGVYFYKNIGTKDHPLFDGGIEIVTTDGKPIAAPNPVVVDVDGDGIPDIVSTEVPYSSNAYRVDWPTAPDVMWYRRASGKDPAHVEPGRPLLDHAGHPVKAGTMARFADMRGSGIVDLLVSDPGYTATIRWYRNAAQRPGAAIDLQRPVVLSGDDIGRFDFMDQPLVVDWFGPNSRDLIVHGVADAHCKWGLRRTALYKNASRKNGELRYRFAGLLTFNGDPEMVPVQSEERPYDVYGSAVSFARDGAGNRHLMMSVGGKLFYFSDLAADGLTFRSMRPIAIAAKQNHNRGWQRVDLRHSGEVKAIRISDDPRGMAHLSDGMLHIVKFEATAGARNVATPEFMQPAPVMPVDRPAALFEFRQPEKLDEIRFLLSGRDANYDTKIVPFSWQGKTYRAGFEDGEPWYQYKVEVSPDGASWTTVANRMTSEMLYSHPLLVDWDGDGKLDLLLYFTSSDGIYPSTKHLRFYRNIGTDDAPQYAAPIDAIDANGKTLSFPADWARTFSPQCGIALVRLESDGPKEVVLEGLGSGELLRFRDISRDRARELRLLSEGPVMMGEHPFAIEAGYWYFDLADADGDGVPDLLDSNGAHILFHRGLRGNVTADPQALTAPPDGVIVLRNGSASRGCPAYNGNSAAMLDAAKPTAATAGEPVTLEFRGQEPDRANQKVTLLRFTGLPATTVRSAVLELSTDPLLQKPNETMLAPLMWVRASSNEINVAWDSRSATFRDAAKDQPWPATFLDRGGTFLSFVEPTFVEKRIGRFHWDVTRAVLDAQRNGRNEVDLLIRVDYTGPYVALYGRVVCGPAWPAADQRPKLMLYTRESISEAQHRH